MIELLIVLVVRLGLIGLGAPIFLALGAGGIPGLWMARGSPAFFSRRVRSSASRAFALSREAISFFRSARPGPLRFARLRRRLQQLVKLALGEARQRPGIVGCIDGIALEKIELPRPFRPFGSKVQAGTGIEGRSWDFGPRCRRMS